MSLNFAARLEDMEKTERRYRGRDADGRVAMHRELAFYDLLDDAEHALLERRFPGELDVDPRDDQASDEAADAARIAWDFRCRELVLAMLGYADEVLAAKLELSSRLEPDADRAALALTATGSIVEVQRAIGSGGSGGAGLRAWVYRPSARPGGGVRTGHTVLREPVRLGNRIQLDDLVTSEVLVLAVGQSLPEEAAPPRFGLFGEADVEGRRRRPGGGTAAQHVDAIRFRVLAEALGTVTPGPDLAAAEERLIALAATMQAEAAQRSGPGLTLGAVHDFTTSWGLTYEVERGPGGRFILVGRRPQDAKEIVLASVDIGEQRVVQGAPLVLRVGALGPLAVIPEVAAVKGLS